MIEMVIESIRVNMINYQRVVILKEKSGYRYLPIWIGPNEAYAIMLEMQHISTPRPLTHDLLLSVTDALGAEVDSVIINELSQDIFYGLTLLSASSGQIEVDCRPSDALALAVRADAPIYVAEAVLDSAGIMLEEESEEPLPENKVEGEGISEDELKKLSAFTDFVDAMDLDDLGNPEQGH